MKRELKAKPSITAVSTGTSVTKPIPMKRELKGERGREAAAMALGHKANPDEKGTERSTIHNVPILLYQSQSQSR